jgi:hypothetical protein
MGGVQLWGRHHALSVGEGSSVAIDGGGQAARTRGRWVRAGGGAVAPLGRVPVRTGRAGLTGGPRYSPRRHGPLTSGPRAQCRV